MDDDGEWDYFLGFGSIHILTYENETKSTVDLLHEVVEEITNKPVVKKDKPRIGFI